jgi:hypothetical protein
MDTVVEYQFRRRIFLKIIPGCFAVFFVCTIFSFITASENIALFVVAAVAICLAIATQLLINCCPGCGKSQFGTITIKGKLIRTRGWALNPYSCPWCKAQLRSNSAGHS